VNTYAALQTAVPLASGQVALAGGAQPHNNLQPYLTLNWCIALQGVFPARS
jgi:microcystin-dependent protein